MKKKNRIKLLKYKLLKRNMTIAEYSRENAELENRIARLDEFRVKYQRLEDAALHFEDLARQGTEVVIAVGKAGTSVKVGHIARTEHSLYPEIHGMMLESIVGMSNELDRRAREAEEQEDEG